MVKITSQSAASSSCARSFLRYYFASIIFSAIPQHLHGFNYTPNTSQIVASTSNSISITTKRAFYPRRMQQQQQNQALEIFPCYSRRYSDDDDDYDDGEYEYATKKSKYQRRRRPYRNYNDEEDDADFEMDDFDEELYIEQYTTIPNPELDYIDPDRTNERVSELFQDKLFWRDLCIFIFVIFIWQEFFIPVNWLSELKHAPNLSGPFPLR